MAHNAGDPHMGAGENGSKGDCPKWFQYPKCRAGCLAGRGLRSRFWGSDRRRLGISTRGWLTEPRLPRWVGHLSSASIYSTVRRSMATGYPNIAAERRSGACRGRTLWSAPRWGAGWIRFTRQFAPQVLTPQVLSVGCHIAPWSIIPMTVLCVRSNSRCYGLVPLGRAVLFAPYVRVVT